MKILVEPGSATGLNVGDVAMYLVAVRRIRDRWPAAEIRVITRDAEKLRQFTPDVIPFDVGGRQAWLEARAIWSRPLKSLAVYPSAARLEKELLYRIPAIANVGMRLKRLVRPRPGPRATPTTFRRAVIESDLFLVCGMGGWNDSFSEYATGLFDLLDIARRAGVPFAAMGQGVGPITLPDLAARASQVLPSISMLACRENRIGPKLLRSLGVPEERIAVTGDDAIALAFDGRPNRLGDGLGINFRVASYAGTSVGAVKRLGDLLAGLGEELAAPLVPIPISANPADSDQVTLQAMLAGREDKARGRVALETPEEVCRQAGTCRVVVTGSYHGAVFALSQGVPAVCLVESEYYAAKFLGLKDQFGDAGAWVVASGDLEAIENAARQAWNTAPGLRDQLLAAAKRQVAAAEAAYHCLFSKVERVGVR